MIKTIILALLVLLLVFVRTLGLKDHETEIAQLHYYHDLIRFPNQYGWISRDVEKDIYHWIKYKRTVKPHQIKDYPLRCFVKEVIAM